MQVLSGSGCDFAASLQVTVVLQDERRETLEKDYIREDDFSVVRTMMSFLEANLH